MAGAGYKLFNSGDVLTAAQVNTYLQEQAVMRFADAAARTTALSGVLAEGMVSYLDSTNAVEVYDGSSWVNVGNAGDITGVTAGTGISGGGTTGTVTITNDMATTITAKGDIVAGTGNATYDNLALGNSGETLVADSSTTTGLRWQGQFMAGKNAIINGDFNINQRAFTSNTTDGSFNFDRWLQGNGGTTGTLTSTPQTFTLGAAPVSGYEGSTFLQCITASGASTNTYAILNQRIENVRTFANQTVTVSFWAKAASGTPKVAIEYAQNFGSGGSPSAQVNTYGGQATLSTSWARYSITFTVPSISGKTIGTTVGTNYCQLALWMSAGSTFDARTGTLGLQNNTFQFWGVQLEAGSVATPFTTATGSIQGELAACQRYYQRTTNTQVYGAFGSGFFLNATDVRILVSLQTAMRIAPTSVDYGTVQVVDSSNTGFTVSALSLAANESSAQVAQVSVTTTGGTTHRFALLRANNSTAGYIGFSAEL